MAGYIEFSPNFSNESAEYMLFEFPPELRNQLKRDGSVPIQEFKNDSYILGDEKLYQLYKFQISNLMLVSEEAKESTVECERIKVRSFQQSCYIPTLVRPFTRDIMIHLKSHYNTPESGLKKEELQVENIKSKFVTNDTMLRKILESVGASIHDGFVINLSPDIRYKISNTIIEKLNEKQLLVTAESTFTIDNLGLSLSNDEEVNLKAVLKNCFEHISDSQDYRLSLRGIINLVIENLKKDVREFYLEDLVDLIKEGVALMLPKAVQDSFGKQKIFLEVESGIKRNFLISDNVEFNAPFQTYVAKNISAVLTDLELLSENPLEK